MRPEDARAGVRTADPAAATTCAIAIMAKESRPGLCKTRLVPPLTPEEAAAINTCFLRDISANIEAAAADAPIQGFAAYHPAGSERFFGSVLPRGFRLLHPPEPGIGRALVHTARALLDQGWRSMCLVNSDSPNLPTSALTQAVAALHAPGERVVLGPSEDGGYYLIGLQRFHARLFADIDWSTGRVTAQTLERAAEIGIEVTLLPTWYDVDDGATLRWLAADLEQGIGAPAPNTRAFVAGLRATGRLE